MAILETGANHDKAVKKRLNSFLNAKYTSRTIQNEVSRHEITEEVKNSEVFSIMADQTKEKGTHLSGAKVLLQWSYPGKFSPF